MFEIKYNGHKDFYVTINSPIFDSELSALVWMKDNGLLPNGTTHWQSYQKAFYKCVDGVWYVWSRFEQEPMHWLKAPGTSEGCLTFIR